MKNKTKIILAILITFVLTLSICSFAMVRILSKYSYPFEKLEKVMSIIDSSYVGEYSFEKCEESAINGILEALGDDYAAYYDEENAKETMQMIEGHYIGIGIEVLANFNKGYIEVMSAFEDSPADRAGIKGGDLIKSIDGTLYKATDMTDAVFYMKGISVENPLDKPIEIVLIRNGEEFSVKLHRAEIDMYKVTHRIVDDICYIRYSGFTIESQKALEGIVQNLENSVEGIVIDVRNNPGGEFNSAINLCDLFLDDGVIMYTVDKNDKKTEYLAKNGSSELPLAILVNGASASASEIFAGSMQARGRAVIVGEKTYGKGVSQTVRYLNPVDRREGALKLTTCKNFTPDGKWINECITPDIVLKNSDINPDITTDEAFLAAVESLKKDK